MNRNVGAYANIRNNHIANVMVKVPRGSEVLLMKIVVTYAPCCIDYLFLIDRIPQV